MYNYPVNIGIFFIKDHGFEVSTARGRLEGALQVLIDRTESESSDESDVDVTDVFHEGRRYQFILVIGIFMNELTIFAFEGSPSSSPRKTPSGNQRKRRRINLEKNLKTDQQAYILKLYDRSVDLVYIGIFGITS